MDAYIHSPVLAQDYFSVREFLLYNCYISFLSNLVKSFSILKKIGQSLKIFLVNYCIENNT